MTNEVTIYIPETGQFLQTGRGLGDNLLPEDRDEGYVDYIYMTVYEYFGDGNMADMDGGMLCLKQSFEDIYKDNTKMYVEKLINDSMQFIFDKIYADYTIIECKGA